MKKMLLVLSGLILTSCATIVNDANIPVALSFSDGSSGECQLSNKRISLSVKIPSQPLIRRSDDPLRFNCQTASGKKGFGSIPSTIEGGKLAGSLLRNNFLHVNKFTPLGMPFNSFCQLVLSVTYFFSSTSIIPDSKR